MKCPFCSSTLSSVVDKRQVDSSGEIRRRRECLKCKKRFTTYERISVQEFFVVKRDGRKELFSRDKLKTGICRALEKRPLFGELDEIVSRLETKIRSKNDKQIESKCIGKFVLLELKKLDTVAYLRFVAVYKKFDNTDDFAKIVRQLST